MSETGCPTTSSDRAAGTAFDVESYWQRRHGAYQGSLKSVGYIHLSERQIAEQYALKASRITEMIARHVPQRTGRLLLDAGCGVGVLTPAYAAMGFDVMGVDFIETAVRQAKAQCPSAEFLVSPLSTLDLDRRFDVIATIDVFLHIVDGREWRKTLETLARHLGLRGVWIILDTFVDDATGWTDHCAPRSLAEFERTLGDFGLHIAERETFTLQHEGTEKGLLAVRRNRKA